MTPRGQHRLVALVGLATGLALAIAAGRADASGAGHPGGEIWIATSPAECPGVTGALFRYERAVADRAEAAMQRLAQTPRRFDSRGDLLRALAGPDLHGWLLVFLSGHGSTETGAIVRGDSRVCLGNGAGPGEWLDIDRDLLPALPTSLSGAVIVLDACSSAAVDPRRARIPTAIISASPYAIDTAALFGDMMLASLAAAVDDNCNGVFDDDDLFAGVIRRQRSAVSLVALEAWPKLRRNAPSPLPLPLPTVPSERCRALTATAERIAATALPRSLAEQRAAQAELARGRSALPRSDHDFFAIAADSAPADARLLRQLARRANLEEISGLTPPQLAALAATTAFAEIYQLAPAVGWLQTRRVRDGMLMSAVRMSRAACGVPARTVISRTAPLVHRLKPRYRHALRYLRDVTGTPPGPAIACVEAEGQCFIMPAKRPAEEECAP
jgi:hypothetical protein